MRALTLVDAQDKRPEVGQSSVTVGGLWTRNPGRREGGDERLQSNPDGGGSVSSQGQGGPSYPTHRISSLSNARRRQTWHVGRVAQWTRGDSESAGAEVGVALAVTFDEAGRQWSRSLR